MERQIGASLILTGTARGSRSAFTLPNSPSSSCCLRFPAWTCRSRHGRWADDRDQICHDRIRACRLLGVARLCAAIESGAAAAQASRHAAAGETRRAGSIEARGHAGDTRRDRNPPPPAPRAPGAAPAKPAATATAPAAPAGDAQPTLLGQYGDWGAYTASPGGNKGCFALANAKTTKMEPAGRNRDPAYVFVSIWLDRNVKNEVSVIIGYPFKSSSDATAEIGTAKFAMYTQNDGAWIKNVAEEARMVEAMRKGADLMVKGTSGRGTQSTDQYSLKGLAQALDKIEQECK